MLNDIFFTHSNGLWKTPQHTGISLTSIGLSDGISATGLFQKSTGNPSARWRLFSAVSWIRSKEKNILPHFT